MRRTLAVFILAVLLGAALWLFSFRTSPTVRAARVYAREFREKIQSDARFTNIVVVVFELGDKSPIGIRGTVEKESDATDLHRTFESLHCPAGVNWVNWQITVATNLQHR
jgi:hypothetical protein